jgi:hypothetical protein
METQLGQIPCSVKQFVQTIFLLREDHKARVRELGLFDKYKWKKSNTISVESLKEYVKTNTTHGDDFIRIFVLDTIGFYSCPTLQPNVKSDYLGLVKDVENIKNINWSSLVLNVLIASIREYKVLKAANLKGNLALL